MNARDLAIKRLALLLGALVLGWLLVQGLGRQFGWTPAVLLIFDMLTLAGFVALAVATVRLVRGQR
ncbi:DUF5337 family protein [Falsirhodobacter sp. alg1]|uniref:DUF5337 family protein n=1 Tax=Falsirhodobacter sp. alg1 TaxID=1472418 RepID=UPI0005ED9D97|nr:DUF5337 family protein [Falsirhodobacter sp. alg1]